MASQQMVVCGDKLIVLVGGVYTTYCVWKSYLCGISVM